MLRICLDQCCKAKQIKIHGRPVLTLEYVTFHTGHYIVRVGMGRRTLFPLLLDCSRSKMVQGRVALSHLNLKSAKCARIRKDIPSDCRTLQYLSDQPWGAVSTPSFFNGYANHGKNELGRKLNQYRAITSSGNTPSLFGTTVLVANFHSF